MNRVLLFLCGLVLLAAGGAAGAAHFGRFPGLSAQAPLVPGTQLPPPWVLVVVAAVAVVLGLLCARWLVAQVPRTPATTWRWSGDDGSTRMSTGVAVAPLTEEISGYPGVRKVEAALTGPHTAPRLALVVRAHADADLREIRRRIDSEGVPRLREALESPGLTATVEFRLAGSSAAAARVS
ncbi:alkaline shock response membrane anchor protein AmaP [Lentzea sp. NPDC042327]|uniref:alkaline shock response membrane anchor protein AmaP n=1 Tax=Lentzea sp. NPDC042327 TaxID=3154801 RepID=UPI0033C1CAB5